MQEDMIHKIKVIRKYHELVSKRSFKWIMAIIMLVVYYAFILTIAFDKRVYGPTPVVWFRHHDRHSDWHRGDYLRLYPDGYLRLPGQCRLR